MRTTKWSIVLALALIGLAGLAILAKRSAGAGENLPVARAGLSLYDRLVNDGKIVTNDIKFAFDRADLRPESMTIINAIAEMMKEHPEVRLSIEGHSDNQGSESYNLELSSLRTASVLKALTGLGIEPSRLKAKGFGESRPITGNDTDGGRARNRRVEFVAY